MTDALDIKAKKMQMAWDMATAAIVKHYPSGGAQSPGGYLDEFAKLLKKATEIVEATFEG